ncbi:MAG TPA: BON domain-containing protein [Chitinophagaceae bacterium]
MSKRLKPVLAILFLIASVTACKQKTTDADIKTAVDNAIAANASLSGTYTDVKDGVVTLTGQVKDDAAKADAETAARGINGVKSVVNNLTVTPPPAVQITADDPLKVSVESTVKSYPGVNATVQDGVITLTGEIKRTDLQQLMAALNSLKPKKVENKLTIKS